MAFSLSAFFAFFRGDKKPRHSLRVFRVLGGFNFRIQIHKDFGVWPSLGF